LEEESMPLNRSIGLAAALVAAAAGSALAQSPASSACPTIAFLSPELAENPSFEIAGPAGPQTCWHNGDPTNDSAADGWFMHSSNQGASVCSKLVQTTAPGPSGKRMLSFKAGGNEGGVYQYVNLDPAKSYMFSVWVYVRKGQVAIQSNAGVGGPVAWSTKQGEWEQLRVCNNSLFSANAMIVYNQDPNGGDFLIDRAELREILQLE